MAVNTTRWIWQRGLRKVCCMFEAIILHLSLYEPPFLLDFHIIIQNAKQFWSLQWSKRFICDIPQLYLLLIPFFHMWMYACYAVNTAYRLVYTIMTYNRRIFLNTCAICPLYPQHVWLKAIVVWWTLLVLLGESLVFHDASVMKGRAFLFHYARIASHLCNSMRDDKISRLLKLTTLCSCD